MESLGLQIYEVVPPPEVKMMSEYLRAAGYYCTNNDKTDYQFVPTATAWDESSAVAHWQNRKPGQPFFAIFNLNVTHESQVFWPTGMKNLRFRAPFPPDPDNGEPAAWKGRLDSSEWKLLVDEDLDVPVPPYLIDNEPTRHDMRRVYSNIIQMDQQVGFLLDQLEAAGELDNTIVFWYTDHGGPLPRQKRLLYDSGIQVPMIIRFPDKAGAGTVDDQLISFIDLAPTVLSLAELTPPKYFQGQAFLGPHTAKAPRDYIHAAADRFDTEYDMIRAVRDKRYKYLRNFQPEKGYYLPVAYRENMVAMQELLRARDAGTLNEYQDQWFRERKPEEELFDTQYDPHELHNLAGDPTYADQLRELRQECERWMKAIDDKGHIPEGELLESFWPNREQPITSIPFVALVDEKINLSCSTPGASIGYQLIQEGETPTSWTVYTEPFLLPEGTTLRVIADRIGYRKSEVVGR
jgi:arylsulfatase A-like enzyme